MSDRERKPPAIRIDAGGQRLTAMVLDPEHPAVIAEMRRVGDRFDPNRNWVHKDGQPYRLSDRVWASGQEQRDTIDRMIKQSIASGKDALKTAKELEQYLNPELRPARHPSGILKRNQPKRIVTATPGRNGKGSYPARRLMRTEVTAAQAIAARDAARLNPFAETMGYNLSPQHPRADVCDPLAERDMGFGPGNYPIADVPMPPRHPHCLCFLTVNVPKNVDAVVDALKYRYNLADPTAADFVQPSTRALESVDRAQRAAINRAAQRLDTQIKHTANRAVQRAATAEPAVTAELQAIGELTGGTLEGLPFRLKTAKSTARKLADDFASTGGSTLAEMEAKLFDNLRYTFVSESAGYDALVRETAAQLQARGYTRLRSKNFWEKPNGYAGVNDIWVTPQGYPFEVQFHTPQSLYTKEKISHPLYEKLRILPDGDPARDLLQRQIDEAWSTLRAAEKGTGTAI